MNLEQLLEDLERDPELRAGITAWHKIPAREGRYAGFPSGLDPRLIEDLARRGIDRLYSHQAEAFERVSRGENVVVVTPTASGKTLCYNLPVLNTILTDPDARALYIFPTKALAQDQRAELEETISRLGVPIAAYTYDGDTPATARRSIRQAGHIVVTNPDMLHTGILPHHTKWVRLFENLRYVVIDELHQYRGVFGSHMANLLRRLQRIARFYGSEPRFICSSATIANPGELAERLLATPVSLITESGAPQGEKHVILYNPPVVNPELGLRRSALKEAAAWGRRFLSHGVQTILFSRSRLSVEILVTYLREGVPGKADRIRGYRGGYLPNERRAIEQGLRRGEILGVVSTNALELGIDIGSLEACVINGYPGSIASTWQQAGRAGRRSGVSAVVLVANSSPLNQFLVGHPDYFLGAPPESGQINPENLYILADHLKCAAFELPFREGEDFGGTPVGEILEFLTEERILRKTSGRYYWMAEEFPANDVSLRSASQENVVIIDLSDGARVIGEVDRFSAPLLVHDQAIYLHETQQYQVERYDYEENKAYVRRVDVDYYTDANLAVDLKVLDVFKHETDSRLWERSYGEVMVAARPTIFKKIKFHTHENVGWGPIHLPEETMHSIAYWLTLPLSFEERYTRAELEGGLLGVANLLAAIAPLYLMCDRQDIRAVPQVRSPFTGRPTIFLYDRYPGGVGLAEKLYHLHSQLLAAAYELVRGCSCTAGCPSCVGPREEVGTRGKEVSLAWLEEARSLGPA